MSQACPFGLGVKIEVKRSANRLLHAEHGVRQGHQRIVTHNNQINAAAMGINSLAMEPKTKASSICCLKGVRASSSGSARAKDLRYAETSKRGHLVLTATPAEVRGDRVEISTGFSRSYLANTAKNLRILPGAGNLDVIAV